MFDVYRLILFYTNRVLMFNVNWNVWKQFWERLYSNPIKQQQAATSLVDTTCFGRASNVSNNLRFESPKNMFIEGATIFSLPADSSWSVSNLRSDIVKLRKLPVASSVASEMQLLLGTRILEDNEVLKSLTAENKLDINMIEVPEDFYVRYFAKMLVGRDREFQEFEFCGNGRFRFARDFLQSGYYEGKQLRKECFLSEATLGVLKSLVLQSGILQQDDSKWPAPSTESRQEIEIKCQGIHVVFATKLHWSLPHVDAGRKCAHLNEMSEFDELAEQIKTFGKSILKLFGVIWSSWAEDHLNFFSRHSMPQKTSQAVCLIERTAWNTWKKA